MGNRLFFGMQKLPKSLFLHSIDKQCMGNKLNILLTNDDGIDSLFLHALAEALCPIGHLTIVAPAGEQSWIGKGISRYRKLNLHPVESPDWKPFREDGHQVFSLDGTPADCVNVGLAHCCVKAPDLVISGINIGFNAGLPFILSSGTVAGALEGALHHLPAIAFSMALPPEQFTLLKQSPPQWSEETLRHLRAGAARAPDFVPEVLRYHKGETLVHNINFPYPVHAETSVRRTVPARLKLGGLFQPDPTGGFGFQFPDLPKMDHHQDTDSGALQSGLISYSVLNFNLLVPGLGER